MCLYLGDQRALANNYFLKTLVCLQHNKATNECSKEIILKSQQRLQVKICIIISVRRNTLLS